MDNFSCLDFILAFLWDLGFYILFIDYAQTNKGHQIGVPCLFYVRLHSQGKEQGQQHKEQTCSCIDYRKNTQDQNGNSLSASGISGLLKVGNRFASENKTDNAGYKSHQCNNNDCGLPKDQDFEICNVGEDETNK